ncbi:MAG: hypothetical protein JSV77_02785 [Dehalococcoidales bacterium]|nr:MAG: hypothetical protein JSV77_02785 [Dehalococcoidales bacterium]
MYTEEDTEEVVAKQEESCWSIDTDWFEANNRSLVALVRGSLCSKCRKRLDSEKKVSSLNDLLTTIRDCCSTEPAYISGELPIMESVFRLFLANGNQALDLIELGRQLSERRGVDTYRTSVEILSRLLKNDRYYGIRLVKP